MVACSDSRADGKAAAFPPEAIGLGEVQISCPGPSIEFRSARPPVRISGIFEPATLGVRFDFQDGQGSGIRCSGILRKFANPAGAEGWVSQAACASGTAGTAQCRLNPPVRVTLLVQRFLMERDPSSDHGQQRGGRHERR